MGDGRAFVLRVDLSAGTVRRESVPERWRRRYLGGKGLGARYLYEELPAGVDPLSPENRLCLLLGPLSGHLPGETRYAAVTKSPLSGGFLDSYAGGDFPERLAGAMPDCLGLLVTGRADDAVVVEVSDGDATIKPAADLAGADTVETDEAFPEAAVACVGPAGENRVRYATIASDGGDHHAGRGGAGAVMGAKNLKAVVARGRPPESTGEIARLREERADAYRKTDTGRWLAAGETIESLDFADEVGALSTRGWQDGRFEGADDIGVEAAAAAATGREAADDAVPGGFRVETDAGSSVTRGATAMTLGAGLAIDDFEAVATLGAVCDRLGVDVIDAGTAVAWAIRADDEGHIDAEATFGDPDTAERLIRRIVTRDGALGDALADGVDIAAERFGGDGLVPTVKSMAVPGYDPRAAASMALAYATSDRGGCHRRARPIEREAFEEWGTDERVRAVVTAQNARSVLWSLVADDFVGETFDDLGAAFLRALDHGDEYDAGDLWTVGERVWTLVRLFNVREGFDRESDALPPTFRQPLDDADGIDRRSFERMLDAYYEARGWNRRGQPRPETLARLGLCETRDRQTPLGAEGEPGASGGDQTLTDD